MSDKLAVVDAQTSALTTMDYAPSAVLGEAQKAAAALKDVIARKPKPVVINGETYLEFEDWQTVGRFYGVTAGLEGEPEFVDLGGVQGFKATAVALRAGVVISRATAFCMKDEDRWAKAPTYQVASMAQTRACAKALRNVLSWVAVLGGYKPTPAEEMDGVQPRRASAAAAPTTGKPACTKCHSAKDVIVGKYKDKKTGVEKPWYCLKCKVTWGNSKAPSSAPAGSQDPDGYDEPWDPVDEGHAAQYDEDR